MSLKIEIEVTYEHIESIIVTALEGGSNFWYLIKDKIRPSSPEFADKSLSEFISDKLFNDPSFSVDIYDIEDDTTLLGKLSQSTLMEGIKKSPYAFGRIMSEDYDANDADVIFQTAIMGEVTFG